MNNFCKHCGLCCKIIPVKEGIILKQFCRDSFENLIKLTLEEAKSINSAYVDEIYNSVGECDFYKCKYISEDNNCLIELKDDCISLFTASATSIAPQECACIGEIFLNKEKLKQKVRRYKEEIIHYEALIATDEKASDAYKRIIINLQKFINRYSVFGSDNW